MINRAITDNYYQVKSITEIQENLSVLKKSLIDAGQRGFSMTGKEEFLEPFDRGSIEFESKVKQLIEQSKSDLTYQADIRKLVTLGTEWRVHYGMPLVRETMKGITPSVSDLEQGKLALDRFRLAKNELYEKLATKRVFYRNQLLDFVTHALVMMAFLFACTWRTLLFYIEVWTPQLVNAT